MPVRLPQPLLSSDAHVLAIKVLDWLLLFFKRPIRDKPGVAEAVAGGR